MSGFVQNAMPIATATIYGFRGTTVTGKILAAHVQQYAQENGKDFVVARHTDSSGDSFIVGLNSQYVSSQIAVIPSLDNPWLRADQQYQLFQIVTCQWGSSVEIKQSVGYFTQSVSDLATYLDSKLGNEAPPRYRNVPFSTKPSFDPGIYLF